MRRTRTSRALQILIAFQSGQKYRSDDLARMLSVSKRTLLRDIKELGKIGIRCDYNPRSRSYEVNPSTFLPATKLTLKEAEVLLLLLHKVRNHLHLPFRNSTLLAALKIENSLSVVMRQHCNTVFRNISVRPEPQAQMDLLDEMFSSLQEAMVRKTTIKLHYDLSDGKEVETDLEPYHLFYGDYGWYVIGKSSFHKSIRTFKLSSIKALEVLNKCFGDGHDFDIHEYFGQAWLMKPEGRLYNIKLRFSPQVAHAVAQVQWHRTQTVTKNNDGSVIIEFRVDGLGEITWWILSYGDQVQVLTPKILRERIAKIAMNIMHSSKSALQAR